MSGNFSDAVRAMRLAEIRQIIEVHRVLYEMWGRWPTPQEIDDYLTGKRAL